MMRIRGIEKARLTLFLLPLLLASFVPPASGATSYAPGVVPGNQWTFGDWAVSCSVSCSQNSVGFLAEVVSLQIVVLNVTGFNVGLNQTSTYYGGKAYSSTAITNTESANNFFLVAGNLVKGDRISNSTTALTVNATIPRFYAGAIRQVNFFYGSGPSNGGFQTLALYWDQVTGALVEINESFSQPGSGTVAIQAKVTSTNLWNPTMPDFALSADPLAPGSINAGSSSTSTITLTSQQTLSGSVQVSAIVLPLITNHPVAAVNPATVTLTAGGTSHTGITITTSSNTVPGIYSVIVNASYTNTIAHFTTLALNVTGPDFSISAISSYLNVDPGSTASTTLVFRSLMNFAGNVALTVLQTQPNSPQPSLSQNSVLLSAGGSANATLTVSAPTSTPPGPYTLFVNGTSGFLTHIIQFYVYVNQPPPPDINITVSPSSLSILVGTIGISIITVTSLGFSGTVNLSQNYYGGSFNATSLTLTPGSSAHAALAIPAGTESGNFTVGVQANGPGIFRSLEINVTVTPPGPDFIITASQQGFTTSPGSAVSSRLTLKSFNGYSDTINILQQPPDSSCQPIFPAVATTVMLTPNGSNTTIVGFTVPSCSDTGYQFLALTAIGANTPQRHELFFEFYVNGTSNLPDFTISPATNSTVKAPQGSVGNFTATLRSINGFSGIVRVIDQTGGVVYPASVSLNPGGTASVTVSEPVYSYATLGEAYFYSLLAISGPISHTLGFGLNVTLASVVPPFYVDLGSYVQLVQGHPAGMTLTLGTVSNFSGNVYLSSIFDPQHLTVTFNQTSVLITPTKPVHVQMTINNASSSSVGDWNIILVVRNPSSSSFVTGIVVDVTSPTVPDFGITLSSASLSLSQGSTGTFNVTVKSLNGFAGTVMLFPFPFDDRPIMLSKSQVSLTPGASVNVTLWVTAQYYQASYPYVNDEFFAVGGTTVRNFYGFISETAGHDFNFYALPSALSFAVGSSASSEIGLYNAGGSSDLVTLSINSYPPGLMLHLNTTTLALSPTNPVMAANLTATGSIPGSYLVVVTAKSAFVTRSTIIVVNISPTPTLSLTATPASLDIPQGGKAMSTITVRSLNGFAGPVSLSANAFNFPQLSLGASSVILTAGGNANVTLTVPVPSNTGTGPYQVGVSGNTTAFETSLIVPVTVTAPLNNFSVSASPSLLPILVGAHSTSTITVNALNGFTGAVTFNNSTSPPGPRCSLSQTSIVLTSTVTSGTSTLTCAGTAQGTYNVTITGTSSNEQHSTVVTVFVPRVAYVPGVSVGQTVTFQVADLTWTSTISTHYLPEPSILILLNDTAHIDLTVSRVSGSTVTVQLSWYFNNGTGPTTGYYSIDVVTGAYNSTGVVPLSFSNSILATGLQIFDHVYETPYSPTINMTTTRTLLGTIRTVNFLNMTMTSPNTVSTVGFVTDQISGMFVGANAQFTINGGTLGTAEATLALRLNSTNIWTTSSKPSVAIIGITPNPANTGQQVTVHFTVSSSTTVSGITVNWGDGTTNTLLGSATTDTHVYANTGTQTHSAFTVNVTATNAAGHASATTVETVNDIPPTVTISSVSPNPASTGQTVTVAFSGTDPDGTVASYTTNWGDSSPLDTLSGATSDTHTYTSPGPYTITVTATDNSGSTGQNTGPVTIQAPVPTVTIGGLNPNPADTGGIVTVSFSVSSTTTVTGITVNWGDGSTPDSLSVSATSDTHTYSYTGNAKSQTFTMTVTATNSAGPGSNSATETIRDRPPTVTVSNVSPNPASAGTIVTVAFSATDPDGTIASFSVNWGDGHTDNSIAGTATSTTHTYLFTGSFTITVTATDNSGSTGLSTKPITVSSAKTSAALSVSCSPDSILAGTSTSCTVTVTGSTYYYPTGSVTLSTNSATGAFTPSTGACLLNTYGTCSITYTDAATSNTTALISASYPGDVYNTGATGSFSLSVVKPSATLTTASLAISCSSSTIQVGSFTTCTVTVTGSSASGTATFSTNSSTGYFTPSNGQCTLDTSATCAVTYTDTATANTTAIISASYLGDTHNTGAHGTSSLNIVKPSNTLTAATNSVTITSGTATADQTSTTGIFVQITGSTATNGTPAAINSKDLSAPSAGVGTVTLSGAKYYDVVVTGTTSGNAKVCINYASATSTTTMRYWSGTAWADATGVAVNGMTVCGQIPVSALNGTNIAVGNAVQPAPTPPPVPPVSNLLLIIAVVIAVVVIAVVAAVSLKRRGRTSQTSQARRQ